MSDDFAIIQSRVVGRISRRRKTNIKPDPVYNNLHVQYLTNILMKNGEKSIAYTKVVLPALQMLKDNHNEDPCQILATALMQVRPRVELRKLRVGSHHQVPVEVKPRRALSKSARFIVDAMASRKAGKRAAVRLYEVLWDSANSRGPAFNRKEEQHKSAEANNAFRTDFAR
jgi:ribosomal protein S7